MLKVFNDRPLSLEVMVLSYLFVISLFKPYCFSFAILYTHTINVLNNICFSMFEIHYHYKYKEIVIHTLSIQFNRKVMWQNSICIFELFQNI